MVERGRGVAGRQGLDLKHGLTVKQRLLIQLSCAAPAPASPPPPAHHPLHGGGPGPAQPLRIDTATHGHADTLRRAPC